MAVDPHSDAARKGLTRGDIILSVNYNAVASIAEFEAAIAMPRPPTARPCCCASNARPPAIYVPIRLR